MFRKTVSLVLTAITVMMAIIPFVQAFTIIPDNNNVRALHRHIHDQATSHDTALDIIKGGRKARSGGGGGGAYRDGGGGSSSSSAYGGKSKRQERVGHLVQTELSKIIHTGVVKGRDTTFLDDDVRQRISIVSVDVSPDLRQARVSVSIRTPKTPPMTASAASSSRVIDDDDDDEQEMILTGTGDAIVDKRRAYSWLVSNTKGIRHTLAQRLSHMKSCPNLSFVQVDVSAAVDVMYLIDQVSSGNKRQSIDLFDGLPGSMEFDGDIPTELRSGAGDDDDDDDDDEWLDEDDEFFG